MNRNQLMQILSDFSEQYGETFEHRCIYDNSFDLLADTIISKVNPVEIIGTGYAKDVPVGESYLQESVVNMWDFAPKGAFTYNSKEGYLMVLTRLTNLGDGRYNSVPLRMEDVDDNIKASLRLKGNKVS